VRFSYSDEQLKCIVRPRYDSDTTHHSHKSPPQTRTLRETQFSDHVAKKSLRVGMLKLNTY